MNESFDEKKPLGEMSIEEQIKEIDRVLMRAEAELKEKESVAFKKELAMSVAIKQKIIAIALTMTCAVCTFAASSFAYFTATTSSKSNTITTGKSDFHFIDLVYPSGSTEGIPNEGVIEHLNVMPGDSVGRDMHAVNKAGFSVYVRACVDVSITLKDKYSEHSGKIDLSHVKVNINDYHWVTRDEFDGYYYYDGILGKGEVTEDLLHDVHFDDDMGNIYKGATVKIHVRFEIVQANGNGNTVFEATGWPADGEEGDD